MNRKEQPLPTTDGAGGRHGSRARLYSGGLYLTCCPGVTAGKFHRAASSGRASAVDPVLPRLPVQRRAVARRAVS
jgi:hypothetical protein